MDSPSPPSSHFSYCTVLYTRVCGTGCVVLVLYCTVLCTHDVDGWCGGLWVLSGPKWKTVSWRGGKRRRMRRQKPRKGLIVFSTDPLTIFDDGHLHLPLFSICYEISMDIKLIILYFHSDAVHLKLSSHKIQVLFQIFSSVPVRFPKEFA